MPGLGVQYLIFCGGNSLAHNRRNDVTCQSTPQKDIEDQWADTRKGTLEAERGVDKRVCARLFAVTLGSIPRILLSSPAMSSACAHPGSGVAWFRCSVPAQKPVGGGLLSSQPVLWGVTV